MTKQKRLEELLRRAIPLIRGYEGAQAFRDEVEAALQLPDEPKAECSECVGGGYCWKCGRQQCGENVGREREVPWVAGPAQNRRAEQAAQVAGYKSDPTCRPNCWACEAERESAQKSACAHLNVEIRGHTETCLNCGRTRERVAVNRRGEPT